MGETCEESSAWGQARVMRPRVSLCASMGWKVLSHCACCFLIFIRCLDARPAGPPRDRRTRGTFIPKPRNLYKSPMWEGAVLRTLGFRGSQFDHLRCKLPLFYLQDFAAFWPGELGSQLLPIQPKRTFLMQLTTRNSRLITTQRPHLPYSKSDNDSTTPNTHQQQKTMHHL